MVKMFKYAVSLISRRKLRTFLTSLGIMIAVMLMTFILFGMTDLQDAVLTQFNSVFKPTDLYVSNSSFAMGGVSSAPRKEDVQNEEKVVIDNNVVESIKSIEGVEEIHRIFAVAGFDVYLQGDDIPYPRSLIQAVDLSADNELFVNFTGDDPVLKENGIFVSNYVTSFFELSADEIIGRNIVLKPSRINNFGSIPNTNTTAQEYTFVVQGVVETDNSAFWINSDRALEILAQRGGFKDKEEYIQTVGYSQLLVSTQDGKTSQVEDALVNDLGLTVISTKTIVDFVSTLTAGLTIALIIFGSISAIVASIGIINTMIMSIYEQTKEIGIIKAIGASDFQVLVIFLIQAGLIGLIGGLLGLSITYLLMKVADPYVVKLLSDQGFTAVTTFFHFQPLNALYITLSSILVGIIAGIYPAMKAAKLDPVNALRYE